MKADFGPILERYNPKIIGIQSVIIWPSFKKYSSFFMSIKERETTIQFKLKFTVKSSNWLPKQFQIDVSNFFT